ncbi:DNA polymerase domain-containing protein [Natronococcus sp. A-GB1]|uniref:DNA polymerase domain-containing protein n=1 Tax=Natronococcus sp. A-GB1 TaxID=3037648 RepID=UPI00241C72E9|nr:DNA polymerase domain-containing protein [Natronococcus sp. A-GB1]MDG5759325.1 DNA polymerase domain-containing protein [Natronococcus sp. A-GB1]
MTEAGQTGLAEFSRESSERPDEEAAAVAGDGTGESTAVIDVREETLPEPTGALELAVMQVDYTIAGYGDDERPIMHVFGRTADGELEHVQVVGFRPYFYAPTESLERPPEEAYDRLTGSREVGEDGEPYESIRGEKLTKIFGQTPRDVGQVRDEFEHYEADILFPNRFLIDKDVRSGIRVPERRADDDSLVVPHEEVEAADVDAEPRVQTFDIEVDDRSGFPEDGEEPIICLTSHDSYRDEYVMWLYEAPIGDGPIPDAVEEYDPIEGPLDHEVRSFEEEEAMLEAFIDYTRATDPDVLTGWNFEDFDAPYLLDRLEVLQGGHEYDLEIDRLSRVDEVWRSNWGGPDIKGRVVFDLLYGYQRMVFSELDSYRLDAVGESELGVGKERYAGDIGDLWEGDPTQLLAYNLRDVEICVELDRQQSIIPFWDEVRAFVGCKLEDAPTPGDAVDMYVLHQAHGQFALPSKGQQEGGEEYEGGAVFDPITGVKENVTVLDLKSLYPMCMTTINASPETRVDPAEYDGETYTAPTQPEPIHFRKEPDGVMREMITELLAEREEKKGLRNDHEPGSPEYEQYDRQQGAVKVIMNSLYGVSGWEQFRLYDKEAASAITATGREVIEFTETAATELNYQVTYGDSVTGDRPIVVRGPDGYVQTTPIETLFERATATVGSSVLITADGGPVGSAPIGKERRELDGWDALSLSNEGTAEWQPIQQVIRHETDDPVVTLQHKFGESTTTRDHSFVVEEGGEYVEATPEEVDEPLRIPELPAVDSVETIDVYEVLDGYTRTYMDGRSVGRANAAEKVKRVHADDEYVWFGHRHHGDLESAIKVKRHVDIHAEEGRALIRLLAAYITEGSASTAETSEAKFGASIAESRPEWLQQIKTDYHCLFENATTTVIASDTRDERTIDSESLRDGPPISYDDRTQKLQMMNELSAVFFREFAGQTSHGKRIPSFVFHLPDDLQELFLGVLVEGDGSRKFPRYSAEYCERNFDYETVSRELAAGLSTLLTQRNQKHSLKYRDEKESYTIRTCDYYRSGRDPVRRETEHDGYVYDLSVAKNENFVDAVGGIVLHNTDSVMLELGPDVSKSEAIEQSFEIEEHINDRYDDFARTELNAEFHRFQIEFEKLYRRFFQAGKKKRYAGHITWKEGKDVDDIDIVGFEYQRSDIAPITKEVQHRVIEMIVRDGDIEGAKEYVQGVIEDVRTGEVSLEEIAIPGGIGKRLDNYDTDTAQVRGAKYANRMLGTNFQRGSKPKRLYLERVDPAFFERLEDEEGLDARRDPVYGAFKRDPDVICFEYDDQIPEAFAVDYDTMLEKTLKGPISRILEALDVSWEEIKSGQEQTGLDQYW